MTTQKGQRRGNGNFRPKRAAPEAAAAILQGTILEGALGHRGGLARKAQEYAAFPLWAEIVGPEIAEVAKPEKILRGRVLVVRVLDAAWAQELTMRKPEILDRIFARKVGAAIEDIQFLSGSPKSVK